MSNQTLDLRPHTVAQAIEGMALSFNLEKAKDLDATYSWSERYHRAGRQ